VNASGSPRRAAAGMASRRVRRRDTRRLLVRGAIALAIVVAVGGGALWLLTAPKFAVARVETDRYRFSDRAELEWRLRWALGRNIWRFDTGAFTDSLRTLPWVRDAAVTRLLPASLHVRLLEWRPLVVVAGAGDRDVLVENGRRLRLPDLLPPLDLPLLVDRVGDAGRGLAPRDAAVLCELVEAVRSTGLETAHPVDFVLRDERGLSLVLAGEGGRLILGREGFAARLTRYLGVRDSIPDSSIVDLRFQRQVTVEKPAPPDTTEPPREKDGHGT
jgi:cell division protein FtsQ